MYSILFPTRYRLDKRPFGARGVGECFVPNQVGASRRNVASSRDSRRFGDSATFASEVLIVVGEDDAQAL
ncbi:MAG: hypothetical protein IJX36_07845, partial [Thermoguttaceae bacterium]|nr:hypothetical protein [Thermoguttaceae bacterium]